MVLLAKQSYYEARRSGILNETLEFIGSIEEIGTALDRKGEISDATRAGAIHKARELLKGKASEYEATHVYGIDYKFLVNCESGEFSVFIYGDGYRPKNRKAKTLGDYSDSVLETARF